jgi:HPt (histidine-containing phosphotransfer) domain-containing protein
MKKADGRHHALAYLLAMNPADEEQVDDDVEAVLRGTRTDFISGFGAAWAAMARLVDVLAKDTSGALRSELEHLLHRMAGLAGTIGFPTVSDHAREFEDHLRDTMPDQLDPTTGHRFLEKIRLGFEQDASP